MVCAVEIIRALQAGIEVCGSALNPIRESVIIITFIVIAKLTGGNQDSSMGIVKGYGLNSPDTFPPIARFSLLQCPDRL
jgi:hypothetical protein